jgi:hypothetical protein
MMNIGTMESWNNGTMENGTVGEKLRFSQRLKPNTPLLQYSIPPAF